MKQDDEIRMPLTSVDMNEERLERLRKLFPEAFADEKIDFERLKQALGEAVDEGRERYGLSWAGKADAIRAIQVPSVGTLIPCSEESVNFDITENLFIEGDNLEVLKLLQKSYHGKIKMIFIDPPYNTGKEYIYADNFRDGLQEYLRFSGQIDDSGIKITTNKETSGRYHSNWLTMMFPRLFLARNLLCETGVIFVSIDDHEVHNLKIMMSEIFGDENFIANIVWQKKYTRSNDARWFSDNHDHILVYARCKDSTVFNLLPRTDDQKAAYRNPDSHPKGPWKATPLHAKSGRGPKSYTFKNGVTWTPPPGTYRRYSDKTMAKMDNNNEIWFGADGAATPSRKTFLSEVKEGVTPVTIWPYEEVGHNHEANSEVKELLGEGIFDNPKPTRLIRRMLELVTSPYSKDTILDFFAGSSTTAHAVLDLNVEDSGNRKFIMVQLPEPIKENSQAFKAGYKSIAEIGKERIRRVIKKIKEEDESKLDLKDREQPEDLGFKVFKLSSSNFKIWDAEKAPQDEKELAEQLKLYADHVLPDRSERDILYELLLKAGLPLTTKIEKKKVEGKTVYSIENGTFLICLEERVTAKALRGMMVLKPQQIICLDNAFGGNDQLKTNTVLEMRDHEIEFSTV